MDWLSDNQWAAWLGLAMTLGVLELVSLDLILAMLAIGALTGMVSSLAGAGLALSVLLAGGASLACLTLLRPSLVKRLHTGPELRIGHGRLVGAQGLVLEPISGSSLGQVKVLGEVWTAAPYDETMTIGVGEAVEVLEFRGATAYVHPIGTLGS